MRSSRVNCSLTSEFALVQENLSLQVARITQLYVIQSEQNPFLWFGVLFVDQGIFKGAVIRFTLFIEETYPDCGCPKVVFDPIPFHPLVNASVGELDTRNAFPGWNSNVKRLSELLMFIKRVIRQADEYFVQIERLLKDHLVLRHDRSTELDHSQEATACRLPEACREDDFKSDVTKLFTWFRHTLEFFRIYNYHPEEFQRRVEEFKMKCYQQLYDKPAICGDDHNALVFSPWNTEIHEPLRSCVLAGRFTPSNLFATYHKETDSVSFIPGHDNTNEN